MFYAQWKSLLAFFKILLLLKCNLDFVTMTSGQILDTDVNIYEHRSFQEYDTAHIGISVAEETGFSETSVFICPTTASHPMKFFPEFHVNFGSISHYVRCICKCMHRTVTS